MNYRSEIDGLRALAVVPVILFHAGFELFSGGFIGVDIFFVISGYLITTIIIEEIESDKFSIVGFYERRARRILPALFLVVLVCLPLAYSWMIPSQLKDFFQSIIAVSLFLSNVLFWYESGYFAADSEEKPLLHTWSLAVEEQYYIFFPVFLFVFWGFGRNRVFVLIIALWLFSLILSEWWGRFDAAANFYLIPTRAWEVLSGSIAAFILHTKNIKPNNFLSLFGIAMIVSALLLFDENTPFPSFYTLLPVLGAFLVVVFGKSGTLVARMLSIKAVVFIGLISYSAYLWHQPILAFARIRFFDYLTSGVLFSLCLFSLFLAYFSWRYVEVPFRYRAMGKKSILPVAFASIFGFVLIGFLGVFFEKYMFNYGQDKLKEVKDLRKEYVDYNWNLRNKISKGMFEGGKVKVLVIGDSNAGDWLNALNESDFSDNASFVYVRSVDVCSPGQVFDGLYQSKVCNYSEQQYQKVRSYYDYADLVFFAVAWKESQVDRVYVNVKKLAEIYGDKFWIIGSKWTRYRFSDFERHALDGVKGPIYSLVDERAVNVNDRLSTLFAGRFIDPYKWLCHEVKCKVVDEEHGFFQYDGFHLTKQGASAWGRWLDEKGITKDW